MADDTIRGSRSIEGGVITIHSADIDRLEAETRRLPITPLGGFPILVVASTNRTVSDLGRRLLDLLHTRQVMIFQLGAALLGYRFRGVVIDETPLVYETARTLESHRLWFEHLLTCKMERNAPVVKVPPRVMHYPHSIEKRESHRLHMDWWGKCRTCRFWAGARTPAVAEGRCDKSDSPLHGELTCTAGFCPRWDSFDLDTAFGILEDEQAGRDPNDRYPYPEPT